ncbi:phosphatidylserine decarboxylase, partial [Salmonella enterica]|uniref:phosphatidylserine decarboxylase n=1 Tax=Salmonella enterica TaxID=28901 RepID=UPI00398C3E3D
CYDPGYLFAFTTLAAKNFPNLFARNVGVICRFVTEFGPMARILVGATIVGSIETVWAETITPPREGIITRWTWPEGEHEGSVALLKGQEMGRFQLASTSIKLLAPGNVNLIPSRANPSATKSGLPAPA